MIFLLAFLLQARAKELPAGHAENEQDKLAIRSVQSHLHHAGLDITILAKHGSQLQSLMQGIRPGILPEVSHASTLQRGVFQLLPHTVESFQPPTPAFKKMFLMPGSEQPRNEEILTWGGRAAIDAWIQPAFAWRNVAKRTAALAISNEGWPERTADEVQARATAESARAMVTVGLREAAQWEAKLGYTDNFEGVPAAYTAAAVAWGVVAKLLITAEASKEWTLSMMPVVAAARATEVASRATAEAAAAAESRGEAAAWTAAATEWRTAGYLIEKKAVEEFRIAAEASWETRAESIGKEAIEEFRAGAEAAWIREEERMKTQEQEEARLLVEKARAAAEASWIKDPHVQKSETSRHSSDFLQATLISTSIRFIKFLRSLHLLLHTWDKIPLSWYRMRKIQVRLRQIWSRRS